MSEEKKLNGTVIVTYRCNARCSMCNRYKAPSKPEEEISMGNLNNQTWDELWNSPQAEEVRKKVRCCDRDCWMIGSVSPAISSDYEK